MLYLILANAALLLICWFFNFFRRKIIQNRLKRILDHTGMGYCEYKTSDGRIIFSNQGFIALFELQLSPSDLKGRYVSEFFTFLEEKGITPEKMREKGCLRNVECVVRSSSGKEKKVSLNPYISVDPYRGEEVIAVLIEDITGVKDSYENMKESQERYEKLFKSSGDMIAIFNFSGLKIAEVNPAAEELTLYSQEELLKKTFIEMIHPLQRKKFAESQDDLLFSNSVKVETIMVRKDGRYRNVMLSMNKLDIKETAMVMAVVKDISSLVTEREEESRKKKEMEQFWKSAVEREERIKELRSSLEKAENRIKNITEGGNGRG